MQESKTKVVFCVNRSAPFEGVYRRLVPATFKRSNQFDTLEEARNCLLAVARMHRAECEMDMEEAQSLESAIEEGVFEVHDET